VTLVTLLTAVTIVTLVTLKLTVFGKMTHCAAAERQDHVL
jgi:hypothetical protein